jgi:hypothetical protein
MKKNVSRSFQWIRRIQSEVAARFMSEILRLQEKPMKTNYETIKRFELRSDKHTRLVTSISAKSAGNRVFFRVATHREHTAHGLVRRSPWLGVRELALKAELEKQAMEFIASESVRQKQSIPAFTA